MRACIPILCVLVGCAPTGKAITGVEQLRTMPASGPVAARTIYPLRAGEWVYEVTDGDDAGESIVRRRGRTERFGATWTETEGDRRDEFWSVDDAGNIVMPAVIDHGENAITFFKPPLAIAWAELAPGVPREQTVQMRVMDAERREKQRDAGTAVQRIEYTGDELLRTPELGTLRARRVEVSFRAELSMAVAENTTILYVGDEHGVIIERREQTVRLLGVPLRSRDQTLVLRQWPGNAPAPPR